MKKRKCSKCGERKPLTEFYKKTKTLYRSDCKVCHRTTMRPRSAAHYKKNKDYYKARNRKRSRAIAAFLRKYKDGQLCTDCNTPHPYWRLDFDHLPKHKKRLNLSSASKQGWSLDRVRAEIAKCELVCANCHRDRTHARRRRRDSNAQP